MRKSKMKTNGDEFSLFPFLDALSGVIGILALIICVLAILGIQDEDLLSKHWGAKHGKRPVFLECRAEGLVIHPAQKLTPINQLADYHGHFRQQIRTTEVRRGTEFFVFLIRPDGIDTYEAARQVMSNSSMGSPSKEVLDAGPMLNFNRS